MEKIKVLQIIPSFGIGGAEKLVLDYLLNFDKNVIDVKCISMYGHSGNQFDKIIDDENLNVSYLNKKPGLDIKMFNEIRKVIRQFDPDIIHSHLYTTKYMLPSIMKNKKIVLFHTIHSEPSKDAVKIDKIANKIIFKKNKSYPIAFTNDMKYKIDKYYNINKTIVVNNGINLDRFKNLKLTKEEARDRIGLDKDKFVIGHVGRFSIPKNHKFLLKIYSEYIKINPNSCLLLVGDGELRNDIENKAKELGIHENIKFLGNRDDIPEILRTMDIFLFPSIYEGFPLALIEAQAANLKCIISDTIDREVILSSNVVTLSLDQDCYTWAKKIQDMKDIVNVEQYLNIDCFDIKNIINNLVNEYIKALNLNK